MRSKIMAHFRDNFTINKGEYLIRIDPPRLDQLIPNIGRMECDSLV